MIVTNYLNSKYMAFIPSLLDMLHVLGHSKVCSINL